MKDIRLKLTRGFSDAKSEAAYGSLDVPGLGVYTSLERIWNDNVPGKSGVPKGFYTLERHNGSKYTGTYALVGETVAHLPGSGTPRSACVIHWEDDGVYLQGCISIGDSMSWRADTNRSKLIKNRIPSVLAHLEKFDRIYLTIA